MSRHAGRRAVEQLRADGDPPRLLERDEPHRRLARARSCAPAGRAPGRARRRARPTARTPSSRWNALTTSRPSARSDLRSTRPTIRSRTGTGARSSRTAVAARACRPRSGGRSRGSAARTGDPRAGCRTGRGARPRVGAGGSSSVRPDVDGGAAVVDVEPLERALVDERVDAPAGSRRRRRFSRQCSTMPASVRAPRARDGPERQLAQPLGLVGLRGREHLGRDHALGEVVEPLEPLTRPRRRARRCSRAARASPSPASSSTSHPRSRPRNGATASGPRSRISARISSARCGCVRSTSPYHAAAAVPHRRRGRAASPRRGSGRPRAPSTRRSGRAPSSRETVSRG